MSSVPQKLLEPFRFVADECLAKAFPDKLRGLGIDIKRFADWATPGTQDHVWLERAGAEGLIVVTKDSKILQRPNEIDSIMRGKTAVFSASRASKTALELVEMFHRAYPGMLEILRAAPPPFIAMVYADSRVSLRLDHTRKEFPALRTGRKHTFPPAAT